MIRVGIGWWKKCSFTAVRYWYMSNEHKKWNPLVLTKENDLLKILPKVEFLKWFIEDRFEDWFFESENDRMIALYGWWGTGKSSVMKTLCESNQVYIEEELTEDLINQWKEAGDKKYWLNNDIEPIFFEAWKYEKDNNLALSLFHFLWDFLYSKTWGEESKKYLRVLWGIAKWFSLNLWVVRISWKNLVEGIENADNQNNSDYRLSEYITVSEIESWIKNLFDNSPTILNKKVLIFIDDLDRCESENVINLLSAIKLFFTYIPNVVFVVGIDKKAVTLALKRKYNDDEDKAEEYLEKIFTMSFNMPIWLTSEKLVGQYFGENPERWKLVVEMFDAIWFNNPRHVKKLLNKLSYIKDTSSVVIDDNQYIIFIYFVFLYEFYNLRFSELIEIQSKEKWWARNFKLTSEHSYDLDLPINVTDFFAKVLMPPLRSEINRTTYWKEPIKFMEMLKLVDQEYNYDLIKYIDFLTKEEIFTKWNHAHQAKLKIDMSEEKFSSIIAFIRNSF